MHSMNQVAVHTKEHVAQNPIGLMTPESGRLDSQRTDDADDKQEEQNTVDPPMYSPVDVALRRTPTWSPLFPPSSFNSADLPADVSRRSSTVTPAESRPKAIPPSRDEDGFMSTLREEAERGMASTIMKHIRVDPVRYLQQEKQWMSRCRGLGSKRATLKTVVTKRQTRSLAPVFAGIYKPRVKPMPKPTPPRRPRESRQPLQAIEVSNTAVLAPPESSPAAKISKPTKPKESAVEKKPLDVAFSTLPDYCPPTTNLDRPPFANDKKCMEVKWTGSSPNKFSLADDPDRHLLHPAEVLCAQSLRLFCAQYLTCKRRIFAAKVAALRNGKGFSKTHAQMACHVDVNKASKLWDRFNHVGWFSDDYFQQYL